MAQGIYSALSGAIATQHQLDVISHNLANVNTAGYREQRVAFSDVLVDQASGNFQVQIGGIGTDTSPGVIEPTGNPLDLALGGEGFFMVGTSSEPMLTRDGTFHVDELGQLVNQAGLTVLNPNRQPIQLGTAGADVLVAADGGLWNEFGPIGQVAVVNARNPRAVRPAGGGLYTTGARNLVDVEHPEVLSGSREHSNVNAVRSMTEMITLHRYFEAMQELVQQHRNLDSRAIRSLGQSS